MLIELFIAARLNSAANSLKRLESNPGAEYATDVIFDWAERRALKRQMRKLEKESEQIVNNFERLVSKPDSSKRNKTKK